MPFFESDTPTYLLEYERQVGETEHSGTNDSDFNGTQNAVDAALEFDPVDKPYHYNKGGIECIDAIKASMSAECFKGYLKGNILKYVWRYEEKGVIQDLEKARVYLSRLIEELKIES